MKFIAKMYIKKILHGSNKDPFVLMYHRVLTEGELLDYPIQPGMYVKKETFKMNIDFLQNNYDILPLDKLLNLVFMGKNMSNCCAITFDDGWYDNYFNAYDVLLKKNTPASFFITTSYIDGNRKTWCEIVSDFLCLNQKEIKDACKKLYLPRELEKILFSNSSRSFKLTYIVQIMKHYDEFKRNYIVSGMKRYICANKHKSNNMLNWDQINEMKDSSLCDFYSHSHSHELLNYKSSNFIKSDLEKSLYIIKKNIQIDDLPIFSYPSGRFDERVINILKNLGVKYSLTTQRGHFNNKSDTYMINRIGIHENIANTYNKIMININ